MRGSGVPWTLLALAATLGCRENPLAPDGNAPPVANAGEDQTFDWTGEPVQVRLDGRGSADSDGEIADYRWLSGAALPDGGVGNLSVQVQGGGETSEIRGGGRHVPPGEPADWPEDVAQPTVTLTQGTWAFSLWVVDDGGAVSEPDAVLIRVGADPVAACVNGVIEGPTQSCKECVCGIDDACRAAVVESACDEACWGLIGCIAAMCPDYAMMAAAGDFSCVTTNCGEFLAGATAARAAGECVAQCADACR